MCFETKLYKKLTWSGDPGDRIEQEQVGSPVAEHKRETERDAEEEKCQKSYSSLFSLCAQVSGWEQRDPWVNVRPCHSITAKSMSLER